jgi:hypothetical protein
MIRLGTSADLPACSDVYRRASLSNAGDRDNLLAHPEYLILGPEGLARAACTSLRKTVPSSVLRARGGRCLEVTANRHAEGFYSAAGFTDSGVADTAFGPSPRKRLTIDR